MKEGSVLIICAIFFFIGIMYGDLFRYPLAYLIGMGAVGISFLVATRNIRLFKNKGLTEKEVRMCVIALDSVIKKWEHFGEDIDECWYELKEKLEKMIGGKGR